MSSANSPLYWGFLRRSPCLLPTWRGWLLLLVLFAVLVIFGFRNANAYLAVSDPAPDGVLVVEGWLPDYALKTVISKFDAQSRRKIYVTGGPLDQGAPLVEYRTEAELDAAILVRMGMNRDAVQPVPAPQVRRDRTYASAVALRDWFSRHGEVPKAINLVSLGAHARRSRLLFQMVFGKDTRVGIIAIRDRRYDPDHWWTSSAGVRSVMDEMVAYGYARFLFFPAKNSSATTQSVGN